MSTIYSTLEKQVVIEFGITIATSQTSNHKEGIPIRGEYKIPYTEDSVPDQAMLMPKQIVLVVTRSENYRALKPFSDVVVFEDDVKDDGTCASGQFQLNVFEYIPFTEGGDYYILCSIGNYLSNIVKVSFFSEQTE